MNSNDVSEIKKRIEISANDAALISQRIELARCAAKALDDTGNRLMVLGHVVGDDRVTGASPFGHGDDESVGVSLVLRIGAQLVSASVDLICDRKLYAATALIRQLVEVEYLAWAFEARDKDAQKWLRSDEKERFELFTPAKLRKAADGKFRSKDYGYHCEFGGHPTPSARSLLTGQPSIAQLFLADMLGHTGRIWDHLLDWANASSYRVAAFIPDRDNMLSRFQAWKRDDYLASMPPPP